MIRRLSDFPNEEEARKFLSSIQSIQDQLLCRVKEDPHCFDFLEYAAEKANDKELKETHPDTIRGMAIKLKCMLEVAMLQQELELHDLEA